MRANGQEQSFIFGFQNYSLHFAQLTVFSRGYLERMQADHELPDSFKFILAAAVFTAAVSALIYGGTALASFNLDHNSGVFLIIPILVAFLCGIVCLFQLPGAYSSWRTNPLLKTRKALLILTLGLAMALFPVGALMVVLGMVLG